MEKKAEVAARLDLNSVDIGPKNAPKLYSVPNTTKPTKNATKTIIHARRESGCPDWDSGCGTGASIR
jgi:hypothetical protein